MAVSDRIAVMNEGSVVQEGTAEDLYHRPASQFVAQFVGRVNLVPGRVTEIAGDTAKVAALGTTIDARVVREGLAPRRRGSARRAARSRSRSPPPLRDADRCTATVTSRTFLGEKIEYLLRCADETLQVVRYDAGPGEIIAEGANVTRALRRRRGDRAAGGRRARASRCVSASRSDRRSRVLWLACALVATGGRRTRGRRRRAELGPRLGRRLRRPGRHDGVGHPARRDRSLDVRRRAPRRRSRRRSAR